MVEINGDWLTYRVRRQLVANCPPPTNSQNREMVQWALTSIDVKGIGWKAKFDLSPFKKVVEHHSRHSDMTVLLPNT